MKIKIRIDIKVEREHFSNNNSSLISMPSVDRLGI